MPYAKTLADLGLAHPVMNAAGGCKTMEELRPLLRSAVSAIVVGSITLEPRAGNPGEVFWPGPQYSLNSLGLPNPGLDYYRHWLPTMAKMARNANKPLIVSVAGFTAIEITKLTYEVMLIDGVSHIEVNLGCPNIWERNGQKLISSFDITFIEALLAELRLFVGPYGLKLSPYSDPSMLAKVAEVIAGYNVSYVATTNTFPNALVFTENGRPALDIESGLGGLGGPALGPIGRGQVKQFRDLLPATIAIIGVGGIRSGRDVADYLRVGAAAVQVGTAYFSRHDPKAFSNILEEFTDIPA